MPKKLLATTIILSLVITMLSSVSIVKANFMPIDTHISIVSPDITANPALHYNYQNSTVNLTISVSYVKEGLTEPPKVYVISYSLDGQPLVYLRNPTETKWFYSQYNQDITNYRATTILENLSEGNHTIEAYANDMSTVRTFIVDPHYVVPTIKILSPTNQNYDSNVPLIFTTNTNLTNANYLMWPKTMDTHFEEQLIGNSTLENLSSGNYVIEVFAITDKGDHIGATANFAIKTPNYSPNQTAIFTPANNMNPHDIFFQGLYSVSAIMIVILATILAPLVYFIRKGKP
jgi:hypothetical protein